MTPIVSNSATAKTRQLGKAAGPAGKSDSSGKASELDFYGWAKNQAALLREGRLTEIDALGLADEIDDVASREYDKLESALTVLFQHILKWDFQAERRLRSWANTIAEQRKRVSRQLARNPSLKSRLEEAITDAYGYGRSGASSETDLDIDIFPSGLPYSWEDIMNREFLFVPPTGN